MKETTASFLNLLFDKGEQICISPNKYGYHSIEQDAISDSITLISPNEDFGPMVIKEDDINLIAVNPIKGFRTDSNVTTFRSFMIEIDTGSLEEQKKYVESSGIPYSACIFSGNKSLHYAITLDEPLPNIDVWRFYNQWLLNVMEKTDQQIKNPSRSIRFPGNMRKNGRKLMQAMVELKGRVTQEEFFKWLYQHEDKKPVQRRERDVSILTGAPDLTKIPAEVMTTLESGITENRNATWFYVACRFAEVGFLFDQTVGYLQPYFQEDKDFKNREWEGCIKSAYKRVYGDDYV